jgi:hypothetical protein
MLKINDWLRLIDAQGRVYQLIFVPIFVSSDPLTRVDCVVIDAPRSTFNCTLPKQAAWSVVRYRVEWQMVGQVGIWRFRCFLLATRFAD